LFLAMFALPLSNRGIMAHTVKYVYVLMKLSTSITICAGNDEHCLVGQ
ncbi:hypothetical protein SAMN05421882_105617, partial [Nitrosomonas communis]